MKNEPITRPRTPGLQGFRPDSGIIRALLRGRRTNPTHPRLTLDEELWICVEYVTNADLGITQIRDRVHISRQAMVDILTAWGIDRRRRNVIPRDEAELAILSGATAADSLRALAA
jgi:hypothetical protein